MEPPGTAPGSDPLITSAFMSIVPKDSWKIGAPRDACKGQRAARVRNKGVEFAANSASQGACATASTTDGVAFSCSMKPLGNGMTFGLVLCAFSMAGFVEVAPGRIMTCGELHAAFGCLTITTTPINEANPPTLLRL